MNAIGPLQPLRPWTLIGHVDATSTDIEPYETAEVVQMKDTRSAATNVVMQMRRDPATPTGQVALGVIERTTLPAVAVGTAAVVAGMAAAHPLGALFWGLYGLATAALTYPIFKDGGRRISTARRLDDIHKEPYWKGTRVYDLGAVDPARAQAGGLNVSMLASSKSAAKPTAQALATYFTETMKQYPAERTAIIFSGHGNAYKDVCGLSVDEAAKSLELTHHATGQKVDLVVMEACLMGNLEAMDKIKDHARFAVVSEETMTASGLPWNSIMPDIEALPLGARNLGELIVQKSAGHWGIPTMSLIDLQHVGALKQSVEDLAQVLDEASRRGHRSQIKKALGSALRLPESEGFVARKLVGVADLGNILNNLAAGCDDPEVQRAVTEAALNFKLTVLSNRRTKEYAEAYGLTIQTAAPGMTAGGYARETGMPKWGQMIQHMRPWPSRMVHWVGDKARGVFR